jgi:hypothetical protein
MLWIFERGTEVRRFETRYDNDTAEYVLVIHDADVAPHIERFGSALAFQRRLETLERQLDAEEWRPVGTPTLLPDGWKI